MLVCRHYTLDNSDFDPTEKGNYNNKERSMTASPVGSFQPIVQEGENPNRALWCH